MEKLKIELKGRMIDFNTRKEIDDLPDTDTDIPTIGKSTAIETSLDTNIEYADSEMRIIKLLVTDNKKVAIINDSVSSEQYLRAVEPFMFGKYLFIPKINNKNKPAVMIVHDAPRATMGYKIDSNYYFGNVDRMVQYIKRFIDDMIEAESNKLAHKTAKIEEKNKIKDNIDKYLKIGDIFYDSWGYEQTNIDFYQVVKFNNSSVWLRPIASESVENTAGHDSVNVKPVKDSFTGDGQPIRKLIQFYANDIMFNSKYGIIRRYDRGDRGVYSSWGY